LPNAGSDLADLLVIMGTGIADVDNKLANVPKDNDTGCCLLTGQRLSRRPSCDRRRCYILAGARRGGDVNKREAIQVGVGDANGHGALSLKTVAKPLVSEEKQIVFEGKLPALCS
jgi:hypothetical protein